MCGIAGVLTSGAAVEEQMLRSMSMRLAHRGPDAQGFFIEGPCGLAHNRLSIIDLTGGQQPIHSPDGNLVLIANGEIYNYLELTEELVRLGCHFATHSDSEVILHAYAAWGLEGLRRLHGMFAFALYDRAAGRLILARDRLGIKPLYWTRLVDRVLFGSELKALLPYCASPELQPEALVQFLGNGHCSGTLTPVRGVNRLPPGHLLVLERDLTMKTVEYWSPLSIAPRQGDYESFAAEFDLLMAQVMTEHQRADVPFGVFLSGGVDSSLMLALLARHHGGSLRTFSVGFTDESVHSESADAAATAQHFGVEHTTLLLDPVALAGRIPHMVWAADDWVLDFAMLPVSLLAERVSRELRVVITGEGGDEVFAGYGRYRHPAALRWLRSGLAPGTGGFRIHGNWTAHHARRVQAQVLQQVRRAERRPLIAAWQESPASWSDLMCCQHVDIRTELADALLPKVDRMLMAFGLEGRVPLLDHRVVEFGLALPDDLKIAPHRGKVFLRRWARQFLPAEILERPKRGFSVPMSRLLEKRTLDELALRLPRNPVLGEYFRPAGIEWLIRSQAKEGKLATPLWGLILIALWHRIFIEGDGSAPPLQSDLLDWL